MARLPVPGGDEGSWGETLNEFLLLEHNPDGTLKLRGDGTFATNSAVANGLDKKQAKTTIVVGPSGDAGFVTDGTDDHVQIQAALDALPSGGVVELQSGAFSVSAGILWDMDNVTLRGQGVDATRLEATTNTFDVITIGRRQVSGIMRNFNHVENLTVTMAGGASTKACIKIDGGGRGTSVKNVQTNEGAYGLQLIDLDRCLFENIDTNNVRQTAIYLQVGLEGTYGTVTFLNCSMNLSDQNSTCMEFGKVSGLGAVNKFDRISLINCLFYATAGLNGTAGLRLAVGATAFSVISSLFESTVTHVHVADESQLTFIGNSFIQNSGQTNDIFRLENHNHKLTVQDCRFQAAVNVFNGVSGHSQLQILGNNNDQGSLTNIFWGQFGAKFGTDTVFAGNGGLLSGVDNQRYEWGFFNQLRINNGAVNGRVLTSDSAGVGTWQTAMSLSLPPASASAPGAPGEIARDNNYFYVCVSSATWKRTPLSSW
jgi:hypothetical protein